MPYRGGMAAKVASIFSSTASVERTPACKYRSPISGVDARASPPRPRLRGPVHRSRRRKKKAVCTGAVFHRELGERRELAFARSRSTRAALIASTAEVSGGVRMQPVLQPGELRDFLRVKPSQ